MAVEQITNLISEQTFGIWFLIGAALVFWMQAGFAMVETGFTRAKNAGNIIMKNLMDFCIGTVVFIVIGFSLLLGEDLAGFIGKPGFDIFTAYESFDFSRYLFRTNGIFRKTTIKSFQVNIHHPFGRQVTLRIRCKYRLQATSFEPTGHIQPTIPVLQFIRVLCPNFTLM